MANDSISRGEGFDFENLESRLFLVAKVLLVACVGLAFVSTFYLTLELDEGRLIEELQRR